MSLDERIARTGHVVKYPAMPAQLEPERWFLCDEFGVVQMRGTIGLYAETCREMVKRGALVEHQTLIAGAVIYKQVQ
jgi:hypothetical protein